MTVGSTWQSTAVYALTALAAGGDLLEEEEKDPYWTSLVYTNCLDDHGRVATLVSDDVRARLRQLAKRRTRLGTLPEIAELRGAGDLSAPDGGPPAARDPEGPPRRAGLRHHDQPHPGGDRRPAARAHRVRRSARRATSEYIQASSRVGRAGDAPGLIVTLFNHARARDRSHYESFRSFHEALYRWVEPMSVTPFSTAALDRLLPAVYVALVRHASTGALQADDAAASFRLGSPAALEAKTSISRRALVADLAAQPRSSTKWTDSPSVGRRSPAAVASPLDTGRRQRATPTRQDLLGEPWPLGGADVDADRSRKAWSPSSSTRRHHERDDEETRIALPRPRRSCWCGRDRGTRPPVVRDHATLVHWGNGDYGGAPSGTTASASGSACLELRSAHGAEIRGPTLVRFPPGCFVTSAAVSASTATATLLTGSHGAANAQAT